MRERRYPSPRAGDLRALAERKEPTLSFFVPVTADVPDASQNQMRHARVVAAGLDRWRSFGADEGQVEKAALALDSFARETSAPTPSVASRVAFWSEDAGVTSYGLPFAAHEAALVATKASMRPIVRAVMSPERYRVLSLSANRVALLEGNEDGLERLACDELPTSLESALGSEVSDPSLQFHSGGSSGTRPLYHGQGGARRGRQIDLERFHLLVARALEKKLGDDPVSLVLAADTGHRPGLEQALGRDIGLIEQQLAGNPDHLSAAALHAAAWPLVKRAAGDARSTLEQARAGKRPLVTRISELVSHSVMGRIRRLWVPEVGSIPGRIDQATGAAVQAWADDDLIDGLVAQVVLRGGAVEVLDGVEFSDVELSLAAELR